MLFNSIEFFIFLPIVFILYWTCFRKSVKWRNLFLLVVSYIFYGWWDWRFLSLIAISSMVDFILGILMNKQEDTYKRKRLLVLSLMVNLGLLGFFKYSNFFIDSFIQGFTFFGIPLSYTTLQIILPVGISFYTFQTLSYTIDVYQRKITPVYDWISFFAFVSFFPQLVAGPIERAKHLLPQFDTLKQFDYQRARSGALLMLGGFFKKIVIADRLALYIDQVFLNMDTASGLPMLVAMIFFAFQLYLDFSAYSDIAIGTARLFGFELSLNFNRPYLSTSFSDFWKRWHISLSSWFRDYLYIPLGGNRGSKKQLVRNILIVFAVSGLWHGASWNFVIWGLLNGLFVVFLDRFLPKRTYGLSRLFNALLVFGMWAVSLLFFRAPSFDTAIQALRSLGIHNSEAIVNFGLNSAELKFTFFVLLGLMIFEWYHEQAKQSVIQHIEKLSVYWRWQIYIVVVLIIVFLGAYGLDFNDNSFIYFQF